jgi:hypothetical protein
LIVEVPERLAIIQSAFKNQQSSIINRPGYDTSLLDGLHYDLTALSAMKRGNSRAARCSALLNGPVGWDRRWL